MTMHRRALLSAYDKTGIESFARGLADRGFEILSTGGTARTLRDAGLRVVDVAEVTGHPELMDGRVKTLHPAIHAGLLARRSVAADLAALREHGYTAIDVVGVNLYPFRETVAGGGASVAEAMEQVDIGGPAMIRAAAKNHASVWTVVDPADYARVLEGLDREGGGGALRRELAGKVFAHVSGYDAAVADFLRGEDGGASRERSSPDLLEIGLSKISTLRYGENPDQEAAFYAPAGSRRTGIAALEQHHGKALSYNNLLDVDGALLSLSPFALSPDPAVCIVKHTTPCGIAVGNAVETAYRRALATDPVSAFGSVIAVNRAVDEAAAGAIGELFVECIVAPDFTEGALATLTRKKNIRILTLPEPNDIGQEFPVPEGSLRSFDAAPGRDAAARRAARFLALYGRDPDGPVFRGIHGGILAQAPPLPPFIGVDDPSWKVVTERGPTPEETADLAFAWASVFGVKSNAILLAREGATLGIGAGQMSRVDASRLAVQKAADAGLGLAGSVLASDAFFPFPDAVEAAAEAGVGAIIQPGGSIRDPAVIEAADRAGIAMICTGRRLFRH